MRIAQIAPLAEAVPPRFYGGTERVVSWLTEELVRRGHEVTLFAAGDSISGARLIACSEKGLRTAGELHNFRAYEVLMLERVCELAQQFDVIHSHLDYAPFFQFRRSGWNTLTTLHGRLDEPAFLNVYSEYAELPVISISNHQRRPMPRLNWQKTIYHGMPRDLFRFNDEPGDYFLFLGRICPEKRPDRAIEIAEKAQVPLLIAAKVDPFDRHYYQDKIEPILRRSQYAKYIGEADDAQKRELLANARALLFPIDWPEPFGLVMIEALASGTPVIAFPHGSVPEIVENGSTGFLCSSIAECVSAVCTIDKIDRYKCRQAFEERFSVERMADSYEEIYERLLDLGKENVIEKGGWQAAPVRG